MNYERTLRLMEEIQSATAEELPYLALEVIRAIDDVSKGVFDILIKEVFCRDASIRMDPKTLVEILGGDE